MKVLVNGKYFTWTDEPVQAFNVYGNLQVIKPIDYFEYNFTNFKKLIINGLMVMATN